MRSEGYCSWVCVCVCVCVSVKSHLTYGASVRPENAVTYSADNEGQKNCGVFSETAPLQRSSTPSIVRPCVQSAIFPAESTHAYGPRPALCFPVLVLAYNYISAAARLFAFATSSGCASPVYLLMLAVWEKLALLTCIHRPWARVPAT